MEEDKYYRIAKAGEGQYREKMSRFLAFAMPVKDVEEAKAEVKRLQNEYHDARHVCWAYMIGEDSDVWQLNDNGEPSGTAGKPILGQIRSAGVTDVLVAVVRYFGGIKLGTSGLIVAYREAAALALADAGRMECWRTKEMIVRVGYERVDKVLKVARENGGEIREQEFDNLCTLRIAVRKSAFEAVKGVLSKIEGVEIAEN